MKTPTTPEGLKKFDHLMPMDAILLAWHDPGSNPEWHAAAKKQVADSMPLLARALDRLPSILSKDSLDTILSKPLIETVRCGGCNRRIPVEDGRLVHHSSMGPIWRFIGKILGDLAPECYYSGADKHRAKYRHLY